jgi:hypothetical protein
MLYIGLRKIALRNLSDEALSGEIDDKREKAENSIRSLIDKVDA